MEEPNPDTIRTEEMEPKTLVQKMAAMVFYKVNSPCKFSVIGVKYNIVVNDNGKF